MPVTLSGVSTAISNGEEATHRLVAGLSQLSRRMPSVLGTLTGRVYIGVHRIRLLLVALPRACVGLWWPVLSQSRRSRCASRSSGFTRSLAPRIHHNQKERPFYIIHARLDWVSVLMPVAECFFSRPRSLIVALSFQLSAPKLRVTRPLLDYAQVAQRPSTSGCHCRRECWHLTRVLRHWRSAVFPCGHSLHGATTVLEQTHLNTD